MTKNKRIGTTLLICSLLLLPMIFILYGVVGFVVSSTYTDTYTGQTMGNPSMMGSPNLAPNDLRMSVAQIIRVVLGFFALCSFFLVPAGIVLSIYYFTKSEDNTTDQINNNPDNKPNTTNQ